MPQSLSRILVHLVFSTKHREPIIAPADQSALHAYLAGTLNAIGCPVIQIGGIADHVHLLFGLSRTHTIADIVKHAKQNAARWLRERDARYRNFLWQSGYGVFSVSPSMADTVQTYIRTQPEHHRKVTFQDEYRALLAKHGIEYDENYVWD
ncbi:putative transposase [Ereboglobus sp. PH5-5]|uniref:IS200/IS605 family transposase n=1 Tax=Ereboglobus sp. PH5-5 TaxID=2940529 RepID=UPI0024065AAB|nr:IS200/IS605 family transposase [Ereboglobus sp. PH5-5]MDF9834447.1 putative transposase [Ereboglobus sp. PH5-5]